MRDSIEKPNGSANKQKEFDYAYVCVSSLFRYNTSQLSNTLNYQLEEKALSKQSVIGVSQLPKDIVQLKLGTITMGRLFTQTNTIDDFQFGKLYVLVQEYSTQSYSNPLGFQYHFQCTTVIDPENQALVVATPVNQTFSLPVPSRLFNTLTFAFFSYRPLVLQQDQQQCYIDYTQPFLNLSFSNGAPHNMTNLDIISLQNFNVPNLLSAENQYQQTYRSNQYRVTIIDDYNLQIPIILDPILSNSLNRPADPTLGIYNGNVVCLCVAGNPTIITSPIPHGMLNGDQITINATSNYNMQIVINMSFIVTVLSPTQFSILFDSTLALGPFTVTVTAFNRLSVQRLNTVQIFIHSKKIDFQFQLIGINPDANNGLININL